jgi:hypothetical protein
MECVRELVNEQSDGPLHTPPNRNSPPIAWSARTMLSD